MEKSAIDCIFDYVEENKVLTGNYKKLCNDSIEMYNKLKKHFNKDVYKEFDNFVNNQLLIEAEIKEHYFNIGFKTGVQLIVDCLNKN